MFKCFNLNYFFLGIYCNKKINEDLVIYIYIYMGWGGESGFNCLGVKVLALLLFLFLCEYIWNEPVVSLVLPAFDDTGSLSSPPHQVVWFHGSTLGDYLPFP